jgi:hypothetical protein
MIADFGKMEAICAEVLDNPVAEEGVLFKVMARGPFEQGQQVGLPIALVIAWAFELMPEGFRQTEDAGNHAWIFIVVIGGALSIAPSS